MQRHGCITALDHHIMYNYMMLCHMCKCPSSVSPFVQMTKLKSNTGVGV